MNPTDFAEKIIAGESLLSLKEDAVQCVTKGTCTIADVLESLEPYLTNLNAEDRGNGVLFLADLLESLPLDLLNVEEMNVITVFLVAKLGDHFTIVPHALKGLSTIIEMNNFPESQVLNLLGSLQMNVTVQTLTQASRLSYYEIMKKLFHNQKKVLKTKSSDFLYAIITGMDSEGDPRNLAFLFNFIPEVYIEFHLEHLTEEAFSVLECYFPIDFTPKADGGITREQLSNGLENCLSSSREFGPFALTLVLEKLESALRVAQVDSLKLLIKGYDVWAIEDINPHATDLWKSLKQLTLQTGDGELVELATRALIGLLQKFSSSAISSNESATLDSILKSISRDTHRFLVDPTLTLFLPSTKLLSGVAGASSVCCDYVFKTVALQLLALAEGKEGHAVALTALSPILRSAIHFNLWNSEESKSALEGLPSSLIALLSDPSLQSGCFLCLNEIIPIMSPELRGDLYCALSTFLCNTDPMPEDAYSSLLMTVTNLHPDEVKGKLLEGLDITGSDSVVSKKKKLLTFCWCCNVTSLTGYCSDKIMDFVSTKISAVEAIECLRDYVGQNTSPAVLHYLGQQCKLIVRLQEACLQSESFLTTFNSEETYVGVSKIIETLMRHLNSEEQKEMSASCLRLYSLKAMDPQMNIPANQIQLLKGLLISLRKDVAVDNLFELVQVLVHSSLKGNGSMCRKSSAILISSIVNKCQDDSSLKYILEYVNAEIDTGLNSEDAIESITLLSWVAKSLILRNHPLAKNWLQKLIGLLNRPEISLEAANGFSIILSESEELSSINFCAERLLFKQWIFQWVFDEQLQKLFNEGEENAQKAAALAIAHIVIAAPSSLVVSAISKLIKVFVLCIESQNTSVASTTLQILSKLLSSEEKAFEDYIDTFIPRLLSSSRSTSMEVRMNALDCVYHYGKYQETKLLPYRNQVIRELETCLDDRKRLVRQKAGRARSRWFLVGAVDDR